MSLIQEQAVQMISLLPDDRVAVLIEVMKGFMKPVESMKNHGKKNRIGIAKGTIYTFAPDKPEANLMQYGILDICYSFLANDGFDFWEEVFRGLPVYLQPF